MHCLNEARQVLHEIAGLIARQLQQANAAARTYRDWETFCQNLTGLTVPQSEALATELGCLLEGPKDLTPAQAVFALQSAFVLFCHCSVAYRFHDDSADLHQEVIARKVQVSPAHALFRDSWQFSAREIQSWLGWIAQWRTNSPEDDPRLGAATFSQLYQAMFPPKARRLLGEFHTPMHLAEQVLADVPALAQPSATVMDPACGCGIFIDAVLRQKRAAGIISAETLLASVFGLEINPAALAGAWAAYCFRLADLLPAGDAPVAIPVLLVNALALAAGSPVAQPATSIPCDVVVGNPPWINWEDLKPAFRQQTAALMKAYGLIAESSAVGAVKLDLAALALVIAVDRLLKPNGTLAFVMPQSALKARAMSGLRRFQLPDGTPFGPVRAHDLAGIQLFAGATNRAACLVVQKGKEPTYPVPTLKWTTGERGKADRLTCRQLASLPLGPDPTAPWLAVPRSLVRLLQPMLAGPCAYTPREGVNTGGGSSFFWGFIEHSAKDGIVAFCTDSTAGRIKGPELTGELVESDLVYPLLKGRGVRRWRCCRDERVLVLPHTSASGMHAIPEEELAQRYPRWWAILSRPNIREHLSQRRSLLRWGGGNFAWYSVFEVGPYTFLPYKVGYRGEVATDFVAAVFATVDHPILGPKLLIPDQTVHYIGVAEEREAHFLAGLLNSVFVRLLYQCFDYKHPSTFFVKCLRIPRFDGGALHQQIADMARVLAGSEVEARELGDQLDRLAAQVFGIPARAVALCRKELRQ
jgi:hypothetical protein